jgi:hypothetical protein
MVRTLVIAASLFALLGQTPQQAPTLGPLNMRGNLPPGEGGVPHGVPAPGAEQATMIAEVKAFEEACERAAVTGDTEFLKKALADTFIMTHGDSWITGDSPIKVDTKTSWIDYVAKKPAPYDYRTLDSVRVEPHGDIAITIGRYRYRPHSSSPTPNTANAGTHLYVWFERVYAKRNGQWQFLSHRTINGPGRELDTK